MKAILKTHNARTHYYLSHERVFNFERCPRRYYYSYVLFAPPDFTPYYLYLGKIVHKILAYIESTGEPFKPFLLDLLFQFEFQEEDEIKKVYDLSLSLISNWRRWRSERDEEEIKGLEKPFQILTNNGTLFKGRIDRVSYQPENQLWVISDYKTGSSKIPRKDIANNLQLNLYAFALSNQEPNIANLRVELIYLRDNDVRGADIHLPNLAEVEARIESEKEEIIKGTEYPPRSGWYCKICRFKTRCSLNETPDKDSIFSLKSLAEDDSSDKRAAAAFALGNSRMKLVTWALVHALRTDESNKVRREAARALGKLADEWTLSFLVKTMAYEPLTEEGLLALELIADRCFHRRRSVRTIKLRQEFSATGNESNIKGLDHEPED